MNSSLHDDHGGTSHGASTAVQAASDNGQREAAVCWRAAFALGFSATVSLWAIAYVSRLPAVMAPAWMLLVLMFGALAVWGVVAGRMAPGGWRTATVAGTLAGALNLLILGSLLASDAPGGLVPSAAWWIPGSLLVMACVTGIAAALARRGRGADLQDPSWEALFSKAALAATFLLVIAGGLVTSNEAGLAVVDWPNTFGYNMFLYPLSRMTGNVYYEHAHRLFGALVGLTTVALALFLWRLDSRRLVRRLGWLAVVLVVGQGVIGGLRVTGGFTLSTDAAHMAPSLVLAAVHGVLGQLFLGLVAALAVVTSRSWTDTSEPAAVPSAAADRSLHVVLLAVLLAQLVLGAVQRHFAEGLMVHITMAVGVTLLAVVAGARAWALYEGRWPIPRLGQGLVVLVILQVALGVLALVVTRGQAMVAGGPGAFEVTVTTAHQACGALLLVCSVALALFTARLSRE